MRRPPDRGLVPDVLAFLWLEPSSSGPASDRRWIAPAPRLSSRFLLALAVVVLVRGSVGVFGLSSCNGPLEPRLLFLLLPEPRDACSVGSSTFEIPGSLLNFAPDRDWTALNDCSTSALRSMESSFVGGVFSLGGSSAQLSVRPCREMTGLPSASVCWYCASMFSNWPSLRCASRSFCIASRSDVSVRRRPWRP